MTNEELRRAIRGRIEEEVTYGVFCDVCNTGDACYDTERDCIDGAIEDGWQIIDDKLTCPDCIRDPGREERRKARLKAAKGNQ